MSAKKKAYVETYGCQMNISDGELMEGILEARGYAIAGSPEEADVILVNRRWRTRGPPGCPPSARHR